MVGGGRSKQNNFTSFLCLFRCDCLVSSQGGLGFCQFLCYFFELYGLAVCVFGFQSFFVFVLMGGCVLPAEALRSANTNCD